MKQLLLSAFVLFVSQNFAFAQITISQGDYLLSTTAKDSAITKLSKKTGFSLPVGGTNQIWDYSTLADSLPAPYYVGGISVPAAASRPSVYASANTQFDYSTSFQAFSIPNITYFQKDATGYYYLGDSSLATRFSLQAITGSAADSLTFPAQNRPYTPSWAWYKFPATANSVWKTNSKFVTNFLLKVGLLGLNNAAGQQFNNISVVDTVIGWGTLRMRNPSGGAALSFNTLLVRSNRVDIDSFFLGGQPAPAQVLGAFGLTQGARTNALRFYFLASGFKAPLLSFELNNSGGIGDIFRGILPNLGLSVNNDEPTDWTVKTTVFPNPTTEGVTFEFEKTTAADWRVFVYNTAGQIIRNDNVKSPIGSAQHTIQFEKNLSSGTYFYQIIDEHSLVRNAGKVVLNR